MNNGHKPDDAQPHLLPPNPKPRTPTGRVSISPLTPEHNVL